MDQQAESPKSIFRGERVYVLGSPDGGPSTPHFSSDVWREAEAGFKHAWDNPTHIGENIELRPDDESSLAPGKTVREVMAMYAITDTI